MPRYVGMLRSTSDAQAHLGPAEAQQLLEDYLNWSEKARLDGVLTGSNPLSRSGRVLRDGLKTTDGPHTEATEIVGGYLEIAAADLDEAERIFGTHPHLAYGPIEIRKIGEKGCED
ncbi:YciI family protein [Amycolatopsis suaedae]|uniref:YCII-related domain-containing protein n=1 Tax=Amycolatopsis suaedae TaxID=2510978 RepID=A0A4Q7JEH3_9PSEU|nr:YciI family protein [Amycolatopsis suaedae]RZQ65103.1 hypothetical protein EWH70_04180 [Amycolatopsis suaedae]